jgi:hypothetical protein
LYQNRTRLRYTSTRPASTILDADGRRVPVVSHGEHVTGCVFFLEFRCLTNVAVQVTATDGIVKVPAHPVPLQPVNVDPGPGVAVSVTVCPAK